MLFSDFGLAGPYTGQMKAVLLRDAPGAAAVDLSADAPTARKLTVVRDATPTPAPARKKVTRGLESPLFGIAGDPLVTGAARLLTIPVRHVYAALWRVGLIEVQA